MKKIIVLLLSTMIIINCLDCSSNSECTTDKTRCSNNVAQICNSDGHWIDFQNCDQTAKQSGGTWICCAVSSGEEPDYSCLPTSQCHLLQ